MDKLRRVLSGQEDNEERGLTEQVDAVWRLPNHELMLTFLEAARNTDILQSLFNFLPTTALPTNNIWAIITHDGCMLYNHLLNHG